MSDNRAHNPDAWIDPKMALEKAADQPVIAIPMRELRDLLEDNPDAPIPTYVPERKPTGME